MFCFAEARFSTMVQFIPGIYDQGFDTPWKWEVYVTLGTITGMNLMFAGMIAKYMFGKKLNPYQAHKDRLRQIEIIIINKI